MSVSYRNVSESVEARFKPLDLCTNSLGYSVINCPELTVVAQNLVAEHIAHRLGRHFDTLSTAARHAIDTAFSQFKDKPARILNKEAASSFLSRLEAEFDFSVTRDLVTDEENLGFANIYWRLVRANSPTDVGPVHADRWFWDLGHGVLPKGYRRVKVWMPLIQDDELPSLMILPGSHEEEFAYESRDDGFGKKKPVFDDKVAIERLTAAPVKVGQAIVFNDSLLHGGRPSMIDRVSIEWTFALLRP